MDQSASLNCNVVRGMQHCHHPQYLLIYLFDAQQPAQTRDLSFVPQSPPLTWYFDPDWILLLSPREVGSVWDGWAGWGAIGDVTQGADRRWVRLYTPAGHWVKNIHPWPQRQGAIWGVTQGADREWVRVDLPLLSIVSSVLSLLSCTQASSTPWPLTQSYREGKYALVLIVDNIFGTESLATRKSRRTLCLPEPFKGNVEVIMNIVAFWWKPDS